MTPLALHAETVPGWFGKITALGDFAHRRLPVAWVDAIDHWVSGGMEGGRQALGDAWLGAYLTSPVWYFACAPRVVDPQDERWWFGLLMPSADAVGRYFPLVVAAAAARPPRSPAEIDHIQQWYGLLQGAALQTLQAGDTQDQFESRLSGLTLPVFASVTEPLTRVESMWSVDWVSSTKGSPLSMLTAMAVQELLSSLRGCSLWWTTPTDDSDRCIQSFPGLPPPSAFTGFMQGAQR